MTVLMVFLAFSAQSGFAQQAPTADAKKAQISLMEAKKALIASMNKPAITTTNDAGLPTQKPLITKRANSPEAVCTTFTGSVGPANNPTSLRGFRDGVASTCAVPGSCTAGLAGALHYVQHSWTNPVNAVQCVTVTYSNPTTNFSFVTAHNGSVTLTDLCVNYLGDPGSSALAGGSIVWSFNAPPLATIIFHVGNVTAGQTADYSLIIDAPICSSGPCAGTPTPGNTITTPAAICPGANFNLTLQNNTPGSGVTYQWESGPTNTGPWSTIGGATNSTYSGTQAVATWYRCNVTCSGNTGISNPVQVLMAPLSACYCTTTYASGCTLGDYVGNVTLGTLNNTTTCATPPYTFFNAVPAPNLIAGGGYPLSITLGPDTFGQHAGAWIDFNQDGDFTDPGECLGVTGNLGPNGSGVINFTVPVTATPGTTRLRVRGGNDSPLTCAQSCGVSSSGFGETEDYNVNIVPCVQILSMSTPANRTVQCSSSTTFTTNLGAASLPTIGWEYRTSPAGLWNLCVNGAGPGGVIFSGATTTTLTLTGIPSTITGYQFRAYASNPCTALDVTPAATLTVVPLVATVNPTAATICNGAIQALTLTNPSSPATQTFTAAGLPIAIPDNNTTGINSTIPVALPVGSIISNVAVKFSVPAHTWPGDLCAVLRAPNGQILNLDWFITGTGFGPGAGMVNTVISGAGTADLSSAAPPYTGTFRADAILAGTPAAGPVGFLPTTTTWAPLYGTPSGNWTFAIYDAFGGDFGSLTALSMDITYGAPSAGVWTSNPAAPNTMFTDPAATVAYIPGSLANTIYVRPAVTTTYTVVYTTASPACVSDPTNITVTVLQPLGTVVQPTDKSVCVGGTTSFSVTAPGGPFGYQWQESRDNGLTWNNVSNGGVYSGATTNTLTLTGVTRSAPVDMNNFLYRVAVNTAPCAGSFTSNNARLTVWALPTVTISATDLALLPNQTSTITGTSNPAPGAAPNWTWTRDGSSIAGATTSSVIADIDRLGVYQATVTDINGCRNSSNNLLIEAEAGEKLWIYPNPTSGQFQIRLYYPGVITEKRRIQIFDSKGAEVLSRDIMLSNQSSPHYQRFDVDLSRQPSGIYLVRVLDLYTKKAISGFVINQTTK